MNQPPLSLPDKINDLDQLIERLNVAEAFLEHGDDLDLTGLEQEVRRVCRAAEKSGSDGAEAVIVRLQEVTDRLERIADLIQNRLAGAGNRHARAIAAYAAIAEGEG